MPVRMGKLIRPTQEQRFKNAVRWVVEVEGKYPSPTAILSALESPRVASHNLSGKECKWRAEALTELGWTYLAEYRSPDRHGIELVKLGRRKRRRRFQWLPPWMQYAKIEPPPEDAPKEGELGFDTYVRPCNVVSAQELNDRYVPRDTGRLK